MAPIKGLNVALLLLCTELSAATVYGASDVPLLENRFRIDHGVREVTFILKKREGSAPVVLVQPDGSKLYSTRHPEGQIGWLVTPDADLITIRDPMPGPWQAIADADSENRIRLLTKVALQTDPLPLRLYQGESVKVTGRLLIDDKPTNDKDYLSSLGMTVRLQSFQTAEMKGEPVQDLVIGSYLDDGKGLDERPHDGVMTAEVVFDAPAGKYRTVISTGNEVFARARHQDILIYPMPFRYEMQLPSETKGPKLTFLIDKDEVDPVSIAVAGRVIDPAGHPLPFNGTASSQSLEIPLPKPAAPGLYHIEGSLFGTTLSGREFRLTLPPKSFNIYPPPPPPEPVISDVAKLEPLPVEESSGWLVWLLGALTVLLGVGGGIGFILLQKRKALKRALAAQQAAQEAQSKAPTSELDLNKPEQ